jgi:hypothetical protein
MSIPLNRTSRSTTLFLFAALILTQQLAGQSGRKRCAGWTSCAVVSLRPGRVELPTFIGKNAFYEIEVLVKRRLPAEEMLCDLGVSMPSYPDCHREPIFQAKWTVRSDGQTTEQGVSNYLGHEGILWSGYEIGKKIGAFRAQKGGRCEVEVELTSDASALDPGEPIIVVRLSND